MATSTTAMELGAVRGSEMAQEHFHAMQEQGRSDELRATYMLRVMLGDLPFSETDKRALRAMPPETRDQYMAALAAAYTMVTKTMFDEEADNNA